jgi:hypothetical protein
MGPTTTDELIRLDQRGQRRDPPTLDAPAECLKHDLRGPRKSVREQLTTDDEH